MDEKPKLQSDGVRLVKRLMKDFDSHVDKERDLTIILLKGHLLIEYYLSHLVLLEYDTEENVDRLSFFAKIKKIDDAKKVTLPKHVIRALYRLNELRNQLAHNLSFQISISEIDTVGFTLGKDYVIKKYSSDSEDRFLLIWVIRMIAADVFGPIFSEIQAVNKESAEKA